METRKGWTHEVDLLGLELDSRARNLLDEGDGSGKDNVNKVSVETGRVGLESL
jgi:hypothetical protein